MKYTLPLLALVVLLLPPAASLSGELKVSRADVIEPDSHLRLTAISVSGLAASANEKNFKDLEEFFAPRVKVFTRSLDPFQPWNRIDDLTGDYLAGIANVMVEQGELEAGMPVPDYRLDAMRQIARLIGSSSVFGVLPEVPGEICTPAAYKVDREAASAFASKFKLDAYSLHFYAHDIKLSKKPRPMRGVRVPAYSLLMFDYDPKAPAGWISYETAGGIKGYMRDRWETLGLSQNHVCFAKVEGKYRISSVFGYGL